MKPYKFRLESLLQVRAIEESKKKEELALAIAETNKKKRDLQVIAENMEKIFSVKEAGNFQQARARTEQVNLLRINEKKCRKELQEQQKKEMDAMKEYQNAATRLKSVVKLKENGLIRYKKERTKYLANQMDELVLLRK